MSADRTSPLSADPILEGLTDRFRVTEVLGAGAFGRVFRAEDGLLRRGIALKVIPLHVDDDADALLREGSQRSTVRAWCTVT